MAQTKTPIGADLDTAYTPLPWHVRIIRPGRSNTPIYQIAVGQDEEHLCAVATINRGTRSVRERHANAEFIVRAVNSHQDLLDACKEAWTSYGRNGDLSVDALQKLEAAIHKAERPAE